MAAIWIWIKAHLGIEVVLDIGKKSYELSEARNKAILAKSAAREAQHKEDLRDVELQMHLLDGKVRKDYGFNVCIVDPQVYVRELNVAPELVQEIRMRQSQERMLASRGASRWRERW